MLEIIMLNEEFLQILLSKHCYFVLFEVKLARVKLCKCTFKKFGLNASFENNRKVTVLRTLFKLV